MTTVDETATPAPGKAPTSPAPAPSPGVPGAADLEAPAAPVPAVGQRLGDLVDVDAASANGNPVRGIAVVVAPPDDLGQLAVCLLPPAVLVDASAVRKR